MRNALHPALMFCALAQVSARAADPLMDTYRKHLFDRPL